MSAFGPTAGFPSGGMPAGFTFAPDTSGTTIVVIQDEELPGGVTQVGICSDALIMLGAEPIASFDEDSKGAQVMSNLYPRIRDMTLRSHPWNCAVKRVALSPDAVGPAFGFSYAFTLPSDWLRVLSNEDEDDCGEYQLEGRKLLSNRKVFNLRYIWRNRIEATYDAMLVSALTLRMAMTACYAITGSAAKEQQLAQQLQVAMRDARSVDAQENPAETFGDSPLLQARLGGFGFGGGWPQ